MIKTIEIEDKEIRLDNNIGWTLIYKDQFGQDILPVIMPILAGALDIVAGIVRESDGKKEISIDTIAKMVDSDELTDALAKVSAAEFVDFINIIWSLAKNADDSISEPKKWIRQFDTFPIDVVGPEVIKLIFKGMVSSKNLERLSELKKSVQPIKR